MSTRTKVLFAVAMVVCVGVGVVMGQFLPRAEAQSTTAAIGAVSATPSQVAGSQGPYTVVPIMDSGAGYSWMEYAVAFAPDGKVTIIRTHPKKADQLGDIVKQFSIK